MKPGIGIGRTGDVQLKMADSTTAPFKVKPLSDWVTWSAIKMDLETEEVYRIARVAREKGIQNDKSLVNNCMISDEYLTIYIPAPPSYEIFRWDRATGHLEMNLSEAAALRIVGEMAQNGMGGLEISGVRVSTMWLFLVAEHVREGLSAPFRDMAADGEL